MRQKLLLVGTELCLLAAAIAAVGFTEYSNTGQEKAFTAIVAIALLAATAVYDCLAFERGAIATISQVILGWQNVFPVVVPALYIVASVLALHFTVPHLPGTPYDWKSIVGWMAVYLTVSIPSMLLGATYLSQEPRKD